MTQFSKQISFSSFAFGISLIWITLEITSSPRAGEEGGEGANRYDESSSPLPSPLRDCVIIHYLSP